jgi:hypothetical protein
MGAYLPFLISQLMPQNYLVQGLAGSLLTAAVLALVFMLITAHRAAYNLRESDELVVLCSLAVSAFTSLACVFYPLANLINIAREQADLWDALSIKHLEPHLRAELASGVLALRVTSIAVGLHATRSLLEALRLDPLPSTPEATQRLFQYQEAVEIDADALSVYRNRFAQTALNLVQSGFYELNILLLWSIKITTDSTLAASLLAWALFYIIDDWRIIFRCSLALKGRFIREQLRQVARTNWLITFAGAWCAWRWSGLVAVVYVACCYLLHRLLLYVAYGVQGHWRIPGALDWKFYDQQIDQATGERKLSR